MTNGVIKKSEIQYRKEEKDMYQLPKGYYPTPEAVAEKMLEGVFSAVRKKRLDKYVILEPSAGDGALIRSIIKAIKKAEHFLFDGCWYSEKINYEIDCIEKDEMLRAALTGNTVNEEETTYCANTTVIFDDFLKFNTCKQYSHIIMNPPFEEGVKHISKALALLERGGVLVCLLNAETLKNPYTNERKELLSRLSSLDAEITYMEGAFADAERPTDVEIALVKVNIPYKEAQSFIYENLKSKMFSSLTEEERSEIVQGGDQLAVSYAMYDLEMKTGVAFISEYYAVKKYIPAGFVREGDESWEKTSKEKPMIELLVGKKKGSDEDASATINEFVCALRSKYWQNFFNNKEITGRFPKEMLDDFSREVKRLSAYDYNRHNVAQIRDQMMQRLSLGVEASVIQIFDRLSEKHSWYPESEKNIHYYNGWRTNCAHKINKKVILPTYRNMFCEGSFISDTFRTHEVYEILCDIEKVLSFFCVESDYDVDMSRALATASQSGVSKNIHLRYFDISLYKKGTVHITFTCEKALDCLNIYGSQKKRWLPPYYGKKHYNEMDDEEKAVIDSFQGEQAYEEYMQNPMLSTLDIGALALECKA